MPNSLAERACRGVSSGKISLTVTPSVLDSEFHEKGKPKPRENFYSYSTVIQGKEYVHYSFDQYQDNRQTPVDIFREERFKSRRRSTLGNLAYKAKRKSGEEYWAFELAKLITQNEEQGNLVTMDHNILFSSDTPKNVISKFEDLIELGYRRGFLR